MQAQTPLSQPPNATALLEAELDKLFVFQDKHLSKERRAILIDEILKLNFPFGAVISGLRSMMMEDLNSIRFGAIVGAIRSRMVPAEEEVSKCDDCMSGYVVMKDAQGRSFSLACRCLKGEAKAKTQGLTRWNGDNSQMVKEHLLSLPFAKETKEDVPF